MTNSHPSKIKIFLLLAMIVTLWSSAFVGIRIGLQGYGPGSLALFRYLIASLGMLFMYLFMCHNRKLDRRDIPIIFGMGALGFGVHSVHNDRKGDLFCRIVVETPVNLTREQKDLFKHLADSLAKGGEKHSPKSQTWFASMKRFFEGLTS